MPRPVMKKLRVPISRAFAVSVIALVAVSQSAWEDRSPLLTTVLFSTGVVLAAVASLGRLWCSLYIAGRKKRVLVTEGPYSISRNPLYFFSLIGVIGVGLATETILVPSLLAVSFAVYYPFTILSEERKLRDLHGEEYEQYKAAVPRFFPRVSGFHEPEEYSVDPIMFRRHLFSALWFIWLIGLLELIEELHELAVIPVFLRIY